MSSKLNINRNIFLEKEELVRFQSFLENNTVNQVMLENTSSWGIVKTVFTGVSPDFKIEVGTNSGTVKLALASKAVDKNKLLIKSPEFDNLAVPSGGLYYWIKVSHRFSNLEEGTCTIATTGEVSGAGTKFTEVIRGQSSEVPVKVKFWKSSGLVNTDIYEVVDFAGDGTLTLAGSSFQAEAGLNYFVIGSTPIGEALTSEQELGLYFYDSSKLEFVLETTSDTPPAGLNTDVEFYLARVKNTAGTVVVTDKRTQFITFNVEGMANKLDKSQNLADLDDAAVARENLGVMTSEDVQNNYFDDSGWLPMLKGAKISSTDYSLNIRRRGSNCVIQGRFTIGGSTLIDGDVVASILYSSLKNSVSNYIYQNNQPVYFSAGESSLASHDANRGFIGIIPQKSAPEDYLKIVVNKGSGDNQNIDLALNISFFLD